MIHQKRFPQPDIPIYQSQRGRKKPALKEVEDVTTFYNDPQNLEKSFEFKVYKDKKLAEQLNLVFKDKCAYCDRNHKAGSSDDIEHFRPKGAVNKFTDLKDQTSQKPGYYWLAADWDNLLISCPRCNRAEKYEQELQAASPPQAAPMTAVFLLGKKDRFPLEDEINRAKVPRDDITREKALLLNPCVDDPEEYFMYVVEGESTKIGIINAKPDISAERRKRAEASIFVYALNRPPLVAERSKCVSDLKRDISQLVQALWIFVKQKQLPVSDIFHETQNLDLAFERLKTAIEKSAPYLGIKRQMFQQALEWESVKELKEKLNVDLSDFLSIGQ